MGEVQLLTAAFPLDSLSRVNADFSVLEQLEMGKWVLGKCCILESVISI